MALSSRKGEYITGSYGACQTIWVRYLLEEMEVEAKKPLVLQTDNKSVINLAKKPVLHGRSKQIEASFHFLRKKINHCEHEVKHCSSEAQLTDFHQRTEDRQILNFEKEIKNNSDRL